MGQLLADAGEEEPREAVAVDGRDAGRADPADEPVADDAQVPPQPVPGKPAGENVQAGSIGGTNETAAISNYCISQRETARNKFELLTSCR